LFIYQSKPQVLKLIKLLDKLSNKIEYEIIFCLRGGDFKMAKKKAKKKKKK